MDVKAEVREDAKRIAQIWDDSGADAARAEFKKVCDKFNLVRWQAVVLADMVHVARATK